MIMFYFSMREACRAHYHASHPMLAMLRLHACLWHCRGHPLLSAAVLSTMLRWPCWTPVLGPAPADLHPSFCLYCPLSTNQPQTPLHLSAGVEAVGAAPGQHAPLFNHRLPLLSCAGPHTLPGQRHEQRRALQRGTVHVQPLGRAGRVR